MAYSVNTEGRRVKDCCTREQGKLHVHEKHVAALHEVNNHNFLSYSDDLGPFVEPWRTFNAEVYNNSVSATFF